MSKTLLAGPRGSWRSLKKVSRPHLGPESAPESGSPGAICSAQKTGPVTPVRCPVHPSLYSFFLSADDFSASAREREEGGEGDSCLMERRGKAAAEREQEDVKSERKSKFILL